MCEPGSMVSTWRKNLALTSLAFVAIVLSCGGCAHYPVNAPLPTLDARTGYRFQNTASPTNSEELLLMLAFSGGGTRAAALAYGVLEELAKIQVGPAHRPHRLLDEVDLISSVSGGSFTAACYALWGNRIFSDFEPQFLKKHIQNGLLLRSLAPWHRLRLCSPTFNRGDLAAEYYDRVLFHGATFADLVAQPGRPFLLINATDIALGARFEFTQDAFDLVRSDLSPFPLSRAVAASSAFPVWLSPIVLKNHSAEYPSAEPSWIHAALTDPAASSRLKNLALQTRSYIDGDRRRFIHLLDGGIADNLGLRGTVDRAIARDWPTGLSPGGPLRNARRIAVIIVDAHIDRDHGWNTRDRSPGLVAVLGSISSAAVSRYSFETIELFRESTARLAREIEASRRGTGLNQTAELAIYTVELHFSQLSDDADRRFFNSVPTRLQLPAKAVDRLRRLAAKELAANREFRQLVRDLGGSVREIE
jgi:NTE family protein